MYLYGKRLIMALIFFQLAGCNKVLETKSRQNLVIPKAVSDLQALMDSYPTMNNIYPCPGEVSSDDYYLTSTDYTALADPLRKMYVWQRENLFPLNASGINEWSSVHRTLGYANLVLAELLKMERTTANARDWDEVKGQALLFRAKCFLQVASIWAPAYDAGTAATDLGVVLRLGSDFNILSVRASVQASYDQILADLRAAIPLLSITPLSVLRPSRPAAYALLARTHLWMRNYTEADRYADSALQLKNGLLDFNTINANLALPIPQFNTELVMSTQQSILAPISNVRARIDSTLYQSYEANDLRKTIFFRNNGNGFFSFRGSFDGSGSLFDGITTGELYLIRAEALARAGNAAAALEQLNRLLSKRWRAGSFIPVTASSASDAVAKILLERRKELVMRGLRWMDVKRLNKEGANITLRRIINGELFTLPPNNPRYALPIPEDIIALTGMQQNPG